MNYLSLEDQQLLELLRQEDEDAFSQVFNRYWKLVFVTANNILQNQTVAQDIVQDVFASLWVRKTEVQIQNLKAYLQQAARFQVLKAIREQKADDQFYKRLADTSTEIFYDNPLLFKEQEALLHKILAGLPDDCLQIFKLNREEQLTYKQIAAQLDISEKTVEKKMSISLKHIRQALQQNMGISIGLMVSFLFDSKIF